MELIFWHWWILAGVLILAELAAPGVFLIWIGLAAAIVGGILWALPGLPAEAQGILFATLSVAAAYLGKRVYDRTRDTDEDPTLNRRAVRYIGRILTLDQPLTNGQGRAQVGETTWKIVGPDLPAGAQVEVVAVEGTALRIEPLTPPPAPAP